MTNAAVKDYRKEMPDKIHMRIIIDKCICSGSGICESICSQFCCNYKGKKNEEEIVSKDYELAAFKAARYCPSHAITITR
jgi:ferredoxin